MDERMSPNVLYVGDLIQRLPWERETVKPRGPWRIVQIHPFMQVKPVYADWKGPGA